MFFFFFAKYTIKCWGAYIGTSIIKKRKDLNMIRLFCRDQDIHQPYMFCHKNQESLNLFVVVLLPSLLLNIIFVRDIYTCGEESLLFSTSFWNYLFRPKMCLIHMDPSEIFKPNHYHTNLQSLDSPLYLVLSMKIT